MSIGTNVYWRWSFDNYQGRKRRVGGAENAGPENTGPDNAGPKRRYLNKRVTTDYMTDKERLSNALPIRRPRKKAAVKNDTLLRTCITKYDDGNYTCMQSLRAVSNVVAHTDALQVTSTNSDTENTEDTTHSTATSTVTVAADMCDVCLLVPRAAVALVPCRHRRFCAPCHALTV